MAGAKWQVERHCGIRWPDMRNRMISEKDAAREDTWEHEKTQIACAPKVGGVTSWEDMDLKGAVRS